MGITFTNYIRFRIQIAFLALLTGYVIGCHNRTKNRTNFSENSSNFTPTSLFDMQIINREALNYTENGFFGTFTLKSNQSYSYLENGEFHFLLNHFLSTEGTITLSLISEANSEDKIDIELQKSNDKLFLKIFNIQHEIASIADTKHGSNFSKFIIRVENRIFSLKLFDEISDIVLFESSNIPIIFESNNQNLFIELHLKNAGISFFKHFKSNLDPTEVIHEKETISHKKFDASHLLLSQDILYKKLLNLGLQNSSLIHSTTWMDDNYVYAKLEYKNHTDTSSETEHLAIACHFHGEKFACHKKDPLSLSPSFETILNTSLSAEEDLFEDLNNLDMESM